LKEIMKDYEYKGLRRIMNKKDYEGDYKETMMMKKRCIRAVFAVMAITAAVAALAGCAGTPPPTATGTASRTDGLSLEEGIIQIARDIGDALPDGCRVAVVGFNSPSERFSGYVLDAMQGALQTSRHLTVTERASLDALRQEQRFQFSGEVDEETAVSLGKFLGAEVVVIGSLTVLGGTTRSARVRFTAIDVEKAVRKASPAATVQLDPVWGIGQ
jgi:curli biogenesis system outer membrane secretion channel CsgG